MAVTLSSFKANHPEFKGDGSTAQDALIQESIDKAIARTPASVWGTGDLQDQGVEYLAAHLLSISPFGINAKLVSKDGKSVYLSERHRLARVVTMGRNVSGFNSADEALLS